MKRNKFIQVRVTEAEHKEIFDGANKIGIPAATFVRATSLEKVRKILEDQE